MLKPCPFCGGKAELKKVEISNGYNRKGVVPPGAVFVEKRETSRGMVIRWKRIGYTIHCNTEHCICQPDRLKYRTEEEAVEAWNRRAEN